MLEETKKRLENIQAIEPYLNAMRNTSLGAWKTALNRINSIHAYRADLINILETLTVPSINTATSLQDNLESSPVWLVIGSQKGLVSNFNRHLIHLLQNEMDSYKQSSAPALPEIYIVTNRPSYYHHFLQEKETQANIIPFQYNLTFKSALQLIKNIPALADKTKSVQYFYNHYTKGHLPVPTKQAMQSQMDYNVLHPLPDEEWPPYLLDTELGIIQENIFKILSWLEFQEILTNSIASENAFRHRILEEAKNNTDRLINELTIEISMARKKEITKEIQELAVAAGLTQ